MPESVSTLRDRVFLARQRLRTAEDINRQDRGSITPAYLSQLRTELEQARRHLADAESPDDTA